MSQSELTEHSGIDRGHVTGVSTADIAGMNAVIDVENIGGITDCTVTLPPGISILTGENATNRTSFLTALNGVLGGDEPTVHGDADTGTVTLTFTANDGEDKTSELSFTRSFTQTNGRNTVTADGDAVCDDADLVTFATLLESNPARRAIRRGDDIRDVLMRPVDTDQLERQIRKQKQKRDALREQYQEIERNIERETELVEQRESLTSEIEDLEREIEELQAQVSEYEAGEDMAEEAEALVNDLEAKREEKRGLQNDVEALEAERDGLLEEETELQTERDELQSPDSSHITATGDTDEQITELETRVSDLQERKDELNTTIDDLTRIIQINQQAVSKTSDLPGLTPDADADTDPGSGSVTDALNPDSTDDTVSCWTCGSTVEATVIESRTAELNDIVSEKRSTVSDITSEITKLREEITALRDTRRERERISDRLQQIETEKKALTDQITEKQDGIDRLTEEISDLQDDVADTEDLRESELLDAYEELNELQYTLGKKQSKLDDVNTDLDAVTDSRDELDDIEDEIDSITTTLEHLRTRVETIEKNVVSEFNHHMEEILDRLTYGNIERVWIERRVPSNQHGSFDTGVFDLHIVRETDDGTAYEDTVATLSESEREVTGVIVTLAGYLVHNVAEYVPFILLDSVEAIDTQRLVELIEYIAHQTDAFLAVALLPEDAAAWPEDLQIPADQLTA